MKTYRPNASSYKYKRLVRGIWFRLALIALVALSLPALPQMFNAQARAGRNVPQGFLFIVNTRDDHNDFSCSADDCTLREAIQAANNTPTDDTILFGLTGSVILTSALPAITDDVDIVGPGAAMLQVERLFSSSVRTFNVTTTGTVSFSGLTVNGNLRFGGGILNSSTGTVNLTNCEVSGNRADFGGGILNNGTLNVLNSTIDNNQAAGSAGGTGHGGGINNLNGIVKVTNSTISGNSATSGGGIVNFLDLGRLSVTNSTISGNSATFGGGIDNRRSGEVNITNCTISGNSASANPAFGPAGGGVANEGTGPFNIKSSIIALNTAAAGADVSGGFASHGFNLIGRRNGGTGFTTPTDLTGTDASILNPQIDPNGLQDNGGPTQTIALLPGSPAIEKGTRFGLTATLITDQRGTGFLRTFDDPAVAPATGGDNTDIGAFELQLLPMTAGASLLINESCPPANGSIDPGERVTVNLELINDGQAATSNLVATLQSSGGLLAPSNPQSYGAIPVNGSVARDFSFTASATLTSGQTITATLQLQDGATNLGTVSFNFTAGPTLCSFVRLVVASSLSRADASTVVGEITVQNIGSVIANDVTLTTATLGTSNSTPLPQNLGNLAPGELATVTVNFANSTPGSSSVLRAGGNYTGGTFSSSKRINIP